MNEGQADAIANALVGAPLFISTETSQDAVSRGAHPSIHIPKQAALSSLRLAALSNSPRPVPYCAPASAPNNSHSTLERESPGIRANARSTHGRKQPSAGIRKQDRVFREGQCGEAGSGIRVCRRGGAPLARATCPCCGSRACSRCAARAPAYPPFLMISPTCFGNFRTSHFKTSS